MQELKFGTDGIRGEAGVFPITPQIIQRIAFAAAHLFSHPKVLLGKDTRISGEWISQALTTGFLKGGATVINGGTMPTAAVSCEVAQAKLDLGVMITASHNPYQDNGIKLFGTEGKKLSPEMQSQLLQNYVADLPERSNGKVINSDSALQTWRTALPSPNLTGLKILLDCAHGAAAYVAPDYLESLGAEVVRQGCSPNGNNINLKVGALHPPTDLDGCDLAICLDGDADRVVLIDPQHGILDGDDILWILRTLAPGPIIGTVMSNGGLEEALENRLIRTQVGDSNVAAAMQEYNAGIGAEPSGHVLFSDGLPTGDGLYAALRLIEHAGRPPYDIAGWDRWPICKQNIRYTGSQIDLNILKSTQAAQKNGQRVIIRYSGTEPVLRIQVEGTDAQKWLQAIVTEYMQLQE